MLFLALLLAPLAAHAGHWEGVCGPRPTNSGMCVCTMPGQNCSGCADYCGECGVLDGVCYAPQLISDGNEHRFNCRICRTPDCAYEFATLDQSCENEIPEPAGDGSSSFAPSNQPTVRPTLSPSLSPTTLSGSSGGSSDAQAEQPSGGSFAADGDVCVTTATNGGSYPSEVSWSLVAANGQTCSEGGFSSGTNYRSCCVAAGSTVTLTLKDSYGDGWNGAALNLAGDSYTFYSGTSSTRTLVWPSSEGGSATGGEDPEAPADDVSSSFAPSNQPTVRPTLSPTSSPGSSGGSSVTPAPVAGSFATDDDVCVTTFVTGGSYPSEVSWRLVAENGQTCNEASYPGETAYRQCCIAAGSTVTLTLIDSYGDGWNGAYLDLAGLSMTFTSGSSSIRSLIWPSTAGGSATSLGGDEPGGDVSSSYAPSNQPTVLPTMTPTSSPGSSGGSGGGGITTDNDICVDTQLNAGSYPSEVSWSLTAENGQACAQGGFSSGTNYRSCCIEAGSEVTMTLKDTYGDGWNGATLEIAGVTMTFTSGYSSTRTLVWPSTVGGPATGESDDNDYNLGSEVPTYSPTNVPTEMPTEQPTVVPTGIPTRSPTDCPTPSPVALPEPEQYCGVGTSWDGESGQCTCAMDKVCGIPAKAKKGQTVDQADVASACDCETFCKANDEANAWSFIARKKGGKCKCLSGDKVQANVASKDNMFMGFI